LVLGALVGLPLGLALATAIVCNRRAMPPTNPASFSAAIEQVGIVTALVLVTPVNVWVYVAVLAANHPSVMLWLLAVTANSATALVASGYIGRECGHVLAARHLKGFGLVGPARRVPVRAMWGRGGRGVAPVHSQTEDPTGTSSTPTTSGADR
jgi:hypothetical protein